MKFAGLEHFKPTTVPAAGAITEVANRRASASGGDGAQLAFPGSVTSGNLLIVAGISHLPGGGAETPVVTDSRGTTYTVVASGTSINGESLGFIAYGRAPSSGACTVEIQFTDPASTVDFSIDEFTGVNVAPLDVNGGTSTDTSNAPSDSITTVATGALIIGLLTVNFSTLTPGASYIEFGSLEDRLGNGYSTVFRIVTAAQAYVVNWTMSDHALWAAQTISFKP
jgi:hypothetical protein